MLRRVERGDQGFTLVELLVAGMVFMVLGGMLLSSLVVASSSSRTTRAKHDMNEEARTSLNRMARELRQADAITYVVNADGPSFSSGALTAVSLRADFNRDGCSGNSVTAPCVTDTVNNPEDITYCYDPTAATAVERHSLWLIPSGLTSAPSSCNVSGAQPILAGRVGGFKLEYRSNEYLYDSSPADGITTWRELDAAGPPVGDPGASDGDINTTSVNFVNSVVIHLTMTRDGLVQDYQTQVDLRNKS
jgi:type II secretory pathway pseudopilin PulG